MNMSTYKTLGSWQGEMADGKGSITMDSIESTYSIPKEFGGLGEGTNPEELIVGAASSCFMITLGAIFQFKNVEYERIMVNSEADFENTQTGPQLREIRHNAIVYFKDRSNMDNLSRYVQDAESGCMVAMALSGNVRVTATGTGVIVSPSESFSEAI